MRIETESWATDLAVAQQFAEMVIVEEIDPARGLLFHGSLLWKNGKFGDQSEYLVLEAESQ